MFLDNTTKELLNKFADTQTALNDNFNPRGSSEVRLGDKMDNITRQHTDRGSYSFAKQGGADGDTPGIGVFLKENDIITRVFLRTKTAFASGGAATVAIKTGAQELKAATAFGDASYTGTQQERDGSTPILVAADGQVFLEVAAADLTDGEYDFYIEYMRP